MRKLVSLVLALLIGLGAAGCGQKTTLPEGKKPKSRAIREEMQEKQAPEGQPEGQQQEQQK